MAKSFDEILAQVKSCSKKKVAVAVAQDENVLEAVKKAKEEGIADSVLVGDADEIKKMLEAFTLSGNFTRPYLSTVVDQYNEVIDEILMEVRIKLCENIF